MRQCIQRGSKPTKLRSSLRIYSQHRHLAHSDCWKFGFYWWLQRLCGCLGSCWLVVSSSRVVSLGLSPKLLVHGVQVGLA